MMSQVTIDDCEPGKTIWSAVFDDDEQEITVSQAMVIAPKYERENKGIVWLEHIMAGRTQQPQYYTHLYGWYHSIEDALENVVTRHALEMQQREQDFLAAVDRLKNRYPEEFGLCVPSAAAPSSTTTTA
jgi:hypothetical protein